MKAAEEWHTEFRDPGPIAVNPKLTGTPVEPAAEPEPKVKVVRPETEPVVEPTAADMAVFTEELIAKMFANLAAHGMSIQDLAG